MHHPPFPTLHLTTPRPIPTFNPTRTVFHMEADMHTLPSTTLEKNPIANTLAITLRRMQDRSYHTLNSLISHRCHLHRPYEPRAPRLRR